MLISLIVAGCADVLKMAPVVHELRRRRPDWTTRLIHTGRVCEEELPASAFEELDIAGPDVCLNVPRGDHVAETAGTMLALRNEWSANRPDAVMVVGGTTGALAAALASAQLGIPVANLEAGLRSFDRRSPGEMNRVLADAVSEWLFTTERSADDNLRAEGRPDKKIHLAGSTLVDTLVRHRSQAARLRFAETLGVTGPFAVVALSKPENVEDALQRRSIAFALLTLADEFDVVCTVSRHAAEIVRAFNLDEVIAGHHRLRLVPAVRYLEFISLMHDAAAVLTDSGGVQAEALVMGRPCVTLNRYTKHSITLAHGANRLAGADPHLAVRYVREAIHGRAGFAPIPEAWDGHASARIVDVIERDLGAAEGSDKGVLTIGSDGWF